MKTSIGVSEIASKGRLEALLSEYKGNLFEFLVAKKMAEAGNGLAVFYQELHPDMLKMLSLQQSFVMENFPLLVKSLDHLSQKTAQEVLSAMDELPLSIKWQGKMAEGAADIVVKTKKQEYPLSLKLCKSGTMVNVKSAGMRSFFSKYFKEFKLPDLQRDFDRFVDHAFYQMAYKMNATENLGACGDFQLWIENGLPKLPGDLKPEQKEILHELYYTVNDYIQEKLEMLFQIDENLFLSSLMPLIGLDDEKLWQVLTYYKVQAEHQYQLDKVEILQSKKFLHEKHQVSFFNSSKKKGNLILKVGPRLLQLRVKPMNVFTTKSYKINAAFTIDP